MELPNERVSELRQLIHSHVSSEGIQEQIRDCISELASQDDDSKQLDETKLLQFLEEKGLIDRVMAGLKLKPLESPRRKPASKETAATELLQVGRKNEAEAVQNRRCLFLRILGGRAFLEHLHESRDPLRPSSSVFILHVHFYGQRFHSASVPCCCEPRFNEGFLLELGKSQHTDRQHNMISLSDALSLSQTIQLVLVRRTPHTEAELVGACSVEWRQVLSDPMGKVARSVEVCSGAAESTVPAGVLDLKLELFPRAPIPLGIEVLSAQLEMEHQQATEREQMFLLYAKQWWREYLEIRPSHSQRLVKIFAQDEEGRSHLVCCYVRPLRVGRMLSGPREAARFVSLVQYQCQPAVGSSGGTGSQRRETWRNLHTLLSARTGDCEDHCTLLCSLLLGYGLEAFVCLGSKGKGLAHAWVLTLGLDGSVTFWESLTGQRFLHPVYDPDSQAGTPIPAPSHPYRTIGCVFNHKHFYGNIQPSDSVLTCQFDLHDSSKWKAMSVDALRAVVVEPYCQGHWQVLPPILPSRIDSDLSSQELEAELMALISQHRQDSGLTSYWDSHLSYLLGPALASYELERCVGVTVGNEEFQEAIRRYIPEGHTFKGFPIQFTHRNAPRMLTACLKSPVCSEILNCHGDLVRLGIRVRVSVYPEDLCATWCMIAAKYRAIV